MVEKYNSLVMVVCHIIIFLLEYNMNKYNEKETTE